MTRAKAQEWAKGVRALSVLLAALIWLSVMLERPGEIKLNAPVYLEQMPAGLRLHSPPPPELEVVIRGPRILLFLLPFRTVGCGLDLSGAGPGPVSVAPTESSFHLDRELKVLRVVPATVPLVLARTEQK